MSDYMIVALPMVAMWAIGLWCGWSLGKRREHDRITTAIAIAEGYNLIKPGTSDIIAERIDDA